MTLAETFLLLVFMIWYSTRPRSAAHPPTRAELLEKENRDLKDRIVTLEYELKDIRERLEVWRKFFDLPMPGSNADVKNLLPKSRDELKKLVSEAGRGKPKCQDDNVLLNVALINGITTIKVIADSPMLRTKLLAEHVDIRPGATLTSAPEVEAVLREAGELSKKTKSEGGCSFDYRLTYATPDDYYLGRERFERYFYPAGQVRAKQPPQH